MARKRNVDAFGKSWSPIDIQNLEKAVKLYERLNYLNQNFADSLSGANNIWKQINEKAEIQEELQRMNIKLNQSQCQEVLRRADAQNKVNEAITKEEQKMRLINNAMSSSSSGTSFSLSNAGSFYQQARLQNDAASALKGAAISAGKKGYVKGTTEYTNYVNEYASTKMKGAADKYSTAASVIQVAADTFSKAVNVFGNLFMQGMRNQYNSYNNNFSNISVRTGMTRSTYFSQQLKINSNLSSQGLYNNVRNSEVTDMWNKLANTGMNQADMIANALDNVITNKIVPYLDTSSQQFNILNSRLDGNFVKQIRGINLYNQEIAGNNYNTEKLLQQIIDEVQPMSDEALQNLTKGSAEMTAIINKLTPIMGADAATQYATQLFKSQKYSDQIMRSGTINEKMGIISSLQKGINIYDPAHYNDFIGAVIDNQLAFMGGAPGYGSTLGGLQTNIFGSAFGIDFGQRSGIKNLQSKGLTGAQLVALTDGSLTDFSTRALANFASDQNQTAKTLQEVYMENIATYVAAIYEQIGYWGDVIGVLLKGIAGVVGAKVVGSIGKKLLSSGGKHAAGGAAKGAAGAAKGGASFGSVALPAAGAVAGAGLGIYNGVQAYNDFKNGDVGYGIADTVGAVAGVTAAGALGASAAGAAGLITVGAAVPVVGWAALAVAGIAAAGVAAFKYADYVENSTDASEELQKALDAEVRQKEENSHREIVALENYQERIKQSTDFETAKKLAIEAGITTEAELREAQIDTKDALVELTEEYIFQKKKLNQDTTQYLKDIKGINNEEQKKFIDEFLTKYGEDMDYGDLGQKDYKALNAYGFQMQEYATQLINEGKISADGKEYSSDTYKHIAYMVEQGLLSHDYTDGNFTEGDYRILFRTGNNADRRVAGKTMLTNGTYYNNVVADSYVRDVLGNKYQYNAMLGNENTIASVLGELVLAAGEGDKTAVENYITQLKNLGVYSKDDLTGQAKTDLEAAMEKVGIPSYRIGLNKVPYDNYLANLHEGEAVLTASTAGELRNLITAYRETSNQGFIVDAAIANQTTILVSKLDEVVKAVQAINGNTVTGGWSSQVRSSMKSMTNTKVFG